MAFDYHEECWLDISFEFYVLLDFITKEFRRSHFVNNRRYPSHLRMKICLFKFSFVYLRHRYLWRNMKILKAYSY